jgi:uncharacterized protein YggE
MDDNCLQVAGIARSEVAPDRVEWQLIVHEAGPDARDAFARCSARLRALAGALESAYVTAGPVAVSPEVDEHRRPTGRQQARAALTAIAPIASAGDLAAAAIEGGADELRGPTLHTSGIEEARDELYAEAVHAARRRAEAMAAAAGRTLGRALSVRDHDDFDMLVAEGHSGAMSLSGGGMPSPPVVPRPTPISAAVQVVFELSD